MGWKIRKEKGCYHGEVRSAADSSQWVCEGGGSMSAALGEGEEWGLRGGESLVVGIVYVGHQAAQTSCVALSCLRSEYYYNIYVLNIIKKNNQCVGTYLRF